MLDRGGHPGVRSGFRTWSSLEPGFTDTDTLGWGITMHTEEHIEEAVGRTVVGGKNQLCINMRVEEGP